jgi:hypothetical protein
MFRALQLTAAALPLAERREEALIDVQGLKQTVPGWAGCEWWAKRIDFVTARSRRQIQAQIQLPLPPGNSRTGPAVQHREISSAVLACSLHFAISPFSGESLHNCIAESEPIMWQTCSGQWKTSFDLVSMALITQGTFWIPSSNWISNRTQSTSRHCQGLEREVFLFSHRDLRNAIFSTISTFWPTEKL